MTTEVSQEMFYWNTADDEKEYFTGAYHALPVLGHTGSSEPGPTFFRPGIYRIVNLKLESISKKKGLSKRRITRTGKIVHSLKETKEMEFPYPPEPDL